jgi:hypothetical protein
MSRNKQKLFPLKQKPSNQLSPLHISRHLESSPIKRCYFQSDPRKVFKKSQPEHFNRPSAGNNPSITQRSNSKLNAKNSGENSSRVEKTFKSSLKSRPTTCSPMKKVKFSQIESFYEAQEDNQDFKAAKLKVLFKNMKTSFKRTFESFPVNSCKKAKAFILGVDTINCL